MSKLKTMPKVGWIVVGIAVALLIMPTAAAAKAALTFTGIEGTSGNKADVTAAGELQTHDASAASLNSKLNPGADGHLPVDAQPSPPKLFHYSVFVSSSNECGLLSTPNGYATIITSIHVVDMSSVAYDQLTITAGSACNSAVVDDAEFPTGNGTQGLDYPTGLGIQSGHVLGYLSVGGDFFGEVTATGYEVPSAQCTGDCL